MPSSILDATTVKLLASHRQQPQASNNRMDCGQLIAGVYRSLRLTSGEVNVNSLNALFTSQSRSVASAKLKPHHSAPPRNPVANGVAFFIVFLEDDSSSRINAYTTLIGTCCSDARYQNQK